MPHPSDHTILRKQAANQNGGMDGSGSGEIRHLMAARRPDRHQCLARFHGLHGRQQLTVRDRHRYIVVIRGIPKRSRHAATARVEIYHGGGRNARQQGLVASSSPIDF